MCFIDCTISTGSGTNSCVKLFIGTEEFNTVIGDNFPTPDMFYSAGVDLLSAPIDKTRGNRQHTFGWSTNQSCPPNPEKDGFAEPTLSSLTDQHVQWFERLTQISHSIGQDRGISPLPFQGNKE